jgi:pantoate--beta-alanine ligase
MLPCFATSRGMKIARTRDDLLALRPSGAISLVPTMGALHDGHLALVDRAKSAGDPVAVSIFVNPLQFEAGDDLARYPRDEAGDLERLEAAGCDLVWLPAVETMYPPDDATIIDVGGPALGWEGEARPGHFRGVATVVARLFGQLAPRHAFFGEKDWQQLQVIRRMVSDLCMDVSIEGVPTVREADGLAMSSRNRFLAASERQAAPLLHRVLTQLAEMPCGESELEDARSTLRDAGFAVDYLALVQGSTMLPITGAEPGARLIAAARIGSVRLLDNIACVGFGLS